MEAVQEFYLNSRIISLVEKIKSIEEERRVILREVKTVKNAAKNSGAGGEVLEEVCENLERLLENVVINVQENDTRKTKKIQQIKRNGESEMAKQKCRYFNRGYCKYGSKCRFFHSQEICDEFVEEGICNKVGFTKRHPKHCRYWTGNPEGCSRSDSCQYLHVESERFGFKEPLDDQHSQSFSSGDKCDVSHENREAVQGYRRTQFDNHIYESEEVYSVTKRNNGGLQFTCKVCEATFDTQKCVKQHGTREHGGPLW